MKREQSRALKDFRQAWDRYNDLRHHWRWVAMPMFGDMPRRERQARIRPLLDKVIAARAALAMARRRCADVSGGGR